MTKEWTDLDYAEFADIQILDFGETYFDIRPPFLIRKTSGDLLFQSDEGEPLIPWTTSTYLGKLVVADACWKKLSRMGIKSCGSPKGETILWIDDCGDDISRENSWPGAVLAAVREVGK